MITCFARGTRRLTLSLRSLSSVDAGGIDLLLTPSADVESVSADASARAARGAMRFEVPDALDDSAPRRSGFSGWGDFFATRGFPEASMLANDRLLLEQLTAAYTCPLTIAAAQRLARDHRVSPDGDVQLDATTGEVVSIVDRDVVTTADGGELEEVYVVGAASLETLLLNHYWPEISTTVEPAMTIVMVGPDVEVASSTPPIVELGPRLSCMFIGDTFETFVARVLGSSGHVDQSAVTPTFSVAFNAGLALDAAAWEPALEILLAGGRPIFTTAVTEAQARADGAWLESRGAVPLLTPTENAFASRLPELVDDPSDESSPSDEAVAYCNGWWQCHVGESGASEYREMDPYE